ncbi:MAG: ubiquitin-like domain-containing protein [Oscillospiraceae bacterium]|nr:ubiquitin-like domain-containing protein [Oscillospiraceae bacterium]
MLQFTAAIFNAAGGRIKKVRNILQNRHAISLLSIFITCVVIFLMTGALYFRNEVVITDGENTYKILTMQTSAENILAEQGITLAGLDYYSFGGFNEPENTATLSITRSYTVSVTADGETFKTEAYAGETVMDVLKRAGVTAGEHDIVVPDLYKPLSGSTIKVARAFGITVYIDGEMYDFMVTPDGSTTVAELLIREGFEFGEEDVYSENFRSIAYPGMQAAISTIRYAEKVEFISLPFETYEEASNLMAIGATEVKVEGVNGEERVVIRQKIVEGEIVSEEIVSRTVLSEPTDEVVLVGKALSTPYSLRDFPEIELVNGLPANYEQKLTGKSTAYTAGPNAGTASGRALQIGTVAVNPSIIPYGSLLYIVTTDGKHVYGAAVAADTGEFIYNGGDVLVDLYKGLTGDNYGNALNWGAKQVDVYIISTGKY